LDLARLLTGSQLDQLLEILQAHGGTVRTAAMAAAGGWAGHARQPSRERVGRSCSVLNRFGMIGERAAALLLSGY
ncbi:MAG: hypothetical protein ABSE77_00550, partial [Acidimicrobiales bacterium]